jgi:hypothetical protein
MPKFSLYCLYIFFIAHTKPRVPRIDSSRLSLSSFRTSPSVNWLIRWDVHQSALTKVISAVPYPDVNVVSPTTRHLLEESRFMFSLWPPCSYATNICFSNVIVLTIRSSLLCNIITSTLTNLRPCTMDAKMNKLLAIYGMILSMNGSWLPVPEKKIFSLSKLTTDPDHFYNNMSWGIALESWTMDTKMILILTS